MNDAPAPILRRATLVDLPDIVRLPADDPLDAGRESFTDPLPGCHLDAFEAIDRDPDDALVVAQAPDVSVAGVLQSTFIPSPIHRGGWRAPIEGVRVAAALRSGGPGRRLFERAIGWAGPSCPRAPYAGPRAQRRCRCPGQCRKARSACSERSGASSCGRWPTPGRRTSVTARIAAV
jgi:hypothetical protein